MKKFSIFLITFLLFITNVSANERIEVNFSKCVDGDTAKVILNDEVITVRFLAVDTPETSHPKKGKEPFGKEAKEYTCKSLTKANKIEIEYDKNSDKLDKYDRHLAWIWVDDYLLQDNLIKEGLAEVAYLYGDYKYTSTLEDHQVLAKLNKKGIWSNKSPINENIFYIVISIIIILCITFLGFISKKNCKKLIKKVIKKYGK